MKKNKLTFSVKKDEGGYTAHCIEFPGIITEGNTKRDLMKMINDAVKGYFEAFPEEKDRLEKIKKGKIIEVAI